MGPDEVLELIGSAPERYESVQAVLRYRGDGRVHKEISERIRHSEAGRSAFRISPKEASEPVERSVPDGPFGWSCRAWYAGKSRWRLETDTPDGGVNIQAVGGPARWWPPGSGSWWEHRVGGGSRFDDSQWFMLATDPYWTFYALATHDFAGVAYELESLDLTVEGSVRWAGRDAVRLVGVPGADWKWEDPDPLSWGADEYEVVVDAERGVLLRCASRLRGKDFDTLEVEEIHFDEHFPQEVFTSREPLPWCP